VPDVPPDDDPDAGKGVDAAPGVDAPVGAGVCGDGVVGAGEDCDDKNMDGSDACVACAWARCGDGKVRPGVETCDDGNTVDDDGCSSICRPCVIGQQRWADPATGHCYSRHGLGLPFDEAQLACAGRRGPLATAGGLGGPIAGLARVPDGSATTAWLGLRRAALAEPHRWITGEPLGYAGWQAGEPTAEGDCVREYPDGLWDADPCDQTESRICEDDGWHLRPTDGHAYRVVPLPLSAVEAEDLCVGLGGGARLVRYADADEQAFVASLVFETGQYWRGPVAAVCTSVAFAPGGPPYPTATGGCDQPLPFVCEID